jgi:hypothetical protein
MIRSSHWLWALGLLVCCTSGGKDDGEDGPGDDGADGSATEEDGDDTVGPPEEDWAVEATITGDVIVELFGEDERGERYSIEWGSEGYDSWPFGSIFLAAYELGDDGQAGRYAGTEVIFNPQMGSSTYELPVRLREEKDVYVYAAIDVLGDGVIGTEDPRGVWPAAIPMVDGQVETEVDITVLAQAADEIVCDNGDPVEITGDAYVTVDYWGGPIKVMLMDSDGNGPYHVAEALEVGAGEGATTSYTLEVCPDYGEMQLVAAWDANLNGLHDGGDLWGVYSATGDRNNNPITVGDRNMTNFPVWLPLGDRPGVDILPFVTMQGTVVLRSGEPLSSLPAGTTIYVVALKYRPSGDIVVTDPAVSFDIQTFTWSDVNTSSVALDWSLLLPSDTIIYLWAFGDTDGDGLVNGPGEPIGAFNAAEHGKTPTGQEGFGGIEIVLSSDFD